MNRNFWMFASAISLAVSSVALADVTGKVTLDGKAPEMKTIDMSGVKECNDQHPDPVSEQTVVADDKGNLANVVVYVKKEEGQEIPGEAPKQPLEITQKGCMYEPHVDDDVGEVAFVVGDDGLLGDGVGVLVVA